MKTGPVQATVARVLVALVCAAFANAALASAVQARDNPMRASESWDFMRHDVLGETVPLDGAARFTLDAPFRAHDPAIVPVRLVAAAGTAIDALTLVIDENPAPVAGEFTFSAAMQPLDMEVRVRVDAYSNIRAIARTGPDEHLMAGRFVRATGGCAAPSSKDAAAALSQMGRMRVDQISTETTPEGLRRQVKLMVRHPNYSGLQRDQVSLLTIPAHFIHTLEVLQGDTPLFAVTGGISISEDPVYVFHYVDSSEGALTVRATDTKGGIFQETFALDDG